MMPTIEIIARVIIATDGKTQKIRRNSDGKLVNVGNFDADGANLNSWNPDNSNGNIGVSFSRSLCPDYIDYISGFSIFKLFIQPPSIDPISCNGLSNNKYLFRFIALTSKEILM